jgi:hypothetical protein
MISPVNDFVPLSGSVVEILKRGWFLSISNIKLSQEAAATDFENLDMDLPLNHARVSTGGSDIAFSTSVVSK